MEKPVLENVHLSSETDVITLREGIKLGRKLGTCPQFDGYRTEEVYPSAAVQSDDEIDAYVRQTVHSGNALTGSCRMGPDDEPHAVRTHTAIYPPSLLPPPSSHLTTTSSSFAPLFSSPPLTPSPSTMRARRCSTRSCACAASARFE